MRFIISFLIILFSLSACTSVNTVSTDGSTSAEKVIGGLGEAFNEQTGISFTFNPTGSGAGISAVLQDRCDFGISSRPLSEEESETLTSTVFAYDSIALIVNKDNPVENLSLEDVRKIFTAEITDWKSVDGKEATIVLIGREAGSGTRDGFEESTGTKNLCKYRQELTSSGDIITTVSQNPNAIGYASLSSIKSNVKILTIDQTAPTDKNIISGKYPLRRPFILVTKTDKTLSENAEAFFNFVVSDKAKNIISKMGAIPANQR